MGDKDRATLYIRGYDPSYRYYRAAIRPEGFYGCYFSNLRKNGHITPRCRPTQGPHLRAAVPP